MGCNATKADSDGFSCPIDFNLFFEAFTRTVRNAIYWKDVSAPRTHWHQTFPGSVSRRNFDFQVHISPTQFHPYNITSRDCRYHRLHQGRDSDRNIPDMCGFQQLRVNRLKITLGSRIKCILIQTPEQASRSSLTSNSVICVMVSQLS